MRGIFISYRRDDATGYVHALRERLSTHFGSNQIFMDIDSIEPGLDFVEVIQSSVSSCAVVLALIGKRWLQPQRLNDSRDFVRLEIETALEKNIRVIPVLLEGAPMPSSEELPGVLAPLARRQAFEISNRHFSDDLGQLTELLERILKGRELENNFPPPLPVAASKPATAGQPSSAPFLPPLPPVPARRSGLRQIASRLATLVAWLAVAVYVLFATTLLVAQLGSSHLQSGSDVALIILVALVDILIVLGAILKLLRSNLAWVSFLSAGILQLLCLLVGLAAEPPKDTETVLALIAFFSFFAGSFFFLAYRIRGKMLRERK